MCGQGAERARADVRRRVRHEAHVADLDAADDPEAKLAEIEERLEKLRSPFRTAETFAVEEIIDPRETRPLLCEFANLAAKRRAVGPSSFGMRP